mmetsp:Transcript_10348/g.19039  ORF Transcript_10348/g.19039 Transcript_10348/m.19039 type:complete len:250 (+) Transcript_10348:52-801(+)
MVFTIACILFDGFEMLDAFGPLEMFAMLGKTLHEQDELNQLEPVQIVTVGFHRHVSAASALTPSSGPAIRNQVVIGKDPLPIIIDLLLVPGGKGVRTEVKHKKMIKLIKSIAMRPNRPKVMSICTGSVLLAKAGLLEGRRATSNKLAMEWAKSFGKKVDWQDEARFVIDGQLATSSGVAAGIDLSLAVIEELFPGTSEICAHRAEYVPNLNPDDDPFYKPTDSAKDATQNETIDDDEDSHSDDVSDASE